jgi:dehydrogenase/reductase SDR family protein 7B
VEINGKTIWITGASSGIGKALALEFSQYTVQLILSARNREALETVAAACGEEKCTILPLDLSKPDTLQAAVAYVNENFASIDILINNGGISQRSTALETKSEVERQIMETNYWGAVQLSKGVLPIMLQQGGGMFVVISSVVGKFGFRLRTTYAASKHALHGYFDSLRAEFQNDGINVLLVCPGRILTQISQNALTADGEKHNQLDPGQAKGLSAEYCARKIHQAIRKEKKEIFVAQGEKWLWQIKRFMPWLYYKLAAKLEPK